MTGVTLGLSAGDAKARTLVRIVRPGYPIRTGILVYWPLPVAQRRYQGGTRRGHGFRAVVELSPGRCIRVHPDHLEPLASLLSEEQLWQN